MTALAPSAELLPYRAAEADSGRGAAVLLPGIARPLTEYEPVLALTLLAEGSSDEVDVLVGVRNPAANRTHQEVASVPTRRVPLLLAEAWMDELRRGGPEHVAGRADLRSEIINLLSLKLGLADPLELGRIRFTVVRLEATQGLSVIGERADGAMSTEQLTMFNACVLLEEGRGELPKATASYDPLVWGAVDNFLAMTATFDAGRLNAGLEGAFVCAYGLCLQTSARMLDTVGAPPGDR